MDRLHSVNPFAKRESHTSGQVITYKVLTITTWLLAVIASIYYTVRRPEDDHRHWRHTIPEQNYRNWSGFTLNIVMVEVYFAILFAMQGSSYLYYLFSSDVDKLNAAAAVGSHFVANNLLHFGFVMLFVRSHFVWAELLLVLNFANLTSLYFRHNAYPRFVHAPVVSGPLAWTFVAIYWNGAIMVHAPNSLVARVFANIFIWSVLGYGAFFLGLYRDYTMGFWLSFLSAALAVAQFQRQFIALQWIFAFIILGLLLISTLAVGFGAVTVKSAKDAPPGVTDSERAPLLADNN